MFRCAMVTDLEAEHALVRAGRYGVIEAAGGRFERLAFRSWPKYVFLPQQMLRAVWRDRGGREDRCRIYFDQPRRFPDFLAVKYFASGRGTSLATVLAALATLETIARIKKSDALLCDVANARITDRMMRRFGWEAHAPSIWHRNYIRRLYARPSLVQVWPQMADEGKFLVET